MLLNPRIFSSAVAVAVTCAVSAAAYYYTSRKKEEINEVMVFCKLQYNAHSYFDKLVSYIEAAKKSVKICMPSIHNPAIQGRLVSLIKKKKIKISMIIDRAGYNGSTHFFIKELIDAGAEIKCKIKEPIYRMQHKFCLVDDKVLMTGTLDWGNDRCADNWNYVYITNKFQLVEPVKKEFLQMWSHFSGDYHPITDIDPCDNHPITEIDPCDNHKITKIDPCDKEPEIADARNQEIADALSQGVPEARSQEFSPLWNTPGIIEAQSQEIADKIAATLQEDEINDTQGQEQEIASDATDREAVTPEVWIM